MATWILIITIYARSMGGWSVAVVSVPGFKTQAACTTAGRTWAYAENDKQFTLPSYVCVPDQ